MSVHEKISRRAKAKPKPERPRTLPTARTEEINETQVAQAAVHDVHESQSKMEEEPSLGPFLPSWGDSSQAHWMYYVPESKEAVPLWAEEWADFLLEWAEYMNMHVVSVSLFITTRPFREILDKARAFNIIADILVDKGLAEWIGTHRKQLRIHWRPLEEWAQIVYRWALKTGSTRIDVKSLVIQNNKLAFSTLPEKDLLEILGILVENKLAVWVDKKKGAIRLKV